MLTAQENLARVELGGQVATGSPLLTQNKPLIVGPALALNFNRYLSFDSTLLISTDNGGGRSTFDGGRYTQGFFGLKATVRTPRFGVFAAAHPGFISWSSVITSFQLPPGQPPILQYGRRSYFAFDAGGGVEFFP